ncbi:MAG: hypothetical protein QM800_15890 [Paludibacter sp.]
MKRSLVTCLLCFLFLANALSVDYLKLVLADGTTVNIPARYVDSLFADNNGKHVYLKIAKTDLTEAVYYSDIYKYSVVLPQTINIASGVNCQLYYGNLHNNRFRISNSLKFSGLGADGEKSWSYLPPDADNNVAITIQNVLANETVNRNIRVVNSKNKTGNLTVLTVGDSFTEIGVYQDVFLNKLGVSGYNVNSIGRKYTASGNNRNENISGSSIHDFSINKRAVKFVVKGVMTLPKGYWPVYSDGTNRWSVYYTNVNSNGDGYMEARLFSGSYDAKLSNGGVLTFANVMGSGQQTINFTSCEDWSLNPFWNLTTNQLDFINYITVNGFQEPNVLVLQFLLNDINQYSTDLDINVMIDNVKNFAEKFHTQFPNAIIVYSLEPIGSLYWEKNGINYDLAYYNRFNMIRKFLAAFEGNPNYSYLHIAPGYAWVDREAGYDLVGTGNSGASVFVNGDYSFFQPVDPIHCNTSGMTQLGNCVYSTILAALSVGPVTGQASQVQSAKKIVSALYYTPTGLQTKIPNKGVYIKRNLYSDGSILIDKGIKQY